MYYTENALRNEPRILPHWSELWGNRNNFNAMQQRIAANSAALPAEMLAANSATFSTDFWRSIDTAIIENRRIGFGMEILDDLAAVQTILDVGKTVKMYNVVGDISDEVKISMDGQAPYSFDQTDYDSDGDPIPVFTAGFGANWRHARGLSSIGVDLVMDSQSAKQEAFDKKLVSYMLEGSAKINVDGKAGQGLTNHRKTKKIDLGAGGANIDLTTATPAALVAFFTTGAFGQTARANGVAKYSVMWVSHEIFANLSRPFDADNVLKGSVLQAILPYAPVESIRPTFAFTGNEFLAYERNRQVVSPLVGAPVGVTPLPRPMPNSNYNFQMLAAIGVQVKSDGHGRSGVLYGAAL